MNKFISVILCFILAFSITACAKGNNDPISENPESSAETHLTEKDIADIEEELDNIYDTTTADIAAQIKDAGLTDSVMFEAVTSYFDLFNKVYEDLDQDITIKTVKNDDGSVFVNLRSRMMDQNGDSLDEYYENERFFAWQTVTDAYGNLYREGAVDLSGNVIPTYDDILYAVENA